MRRISRKTIAVAILIAAAAAGAAVDGWAGAFLWPLALCAVLLLICVSLIGIVAVVSFGRRHSRFHELRRRIGLLSTDQLRDLIANPSNNGSMLARAELMRRGVDARPPKDQLFEMLASGNSTVCAQAIVSMQLFYPKMFTLLIPMGASNLDPPETWQARIAALRAAG
jgi:hypothetical protein